MFVCVIDEFQQTLVTPLKYTKDASKWLLPSMPYT